MGRKSYTLGNRDSIGDVLGGYPETQQLVTYKGKVVGEFPEPPKKKEKWNKSKGVQLEPVNTNGHYFSSKKNSYMKQFSGLDGTNRNF